MFTTSTILALVVYSKSWELQVNVTLYARRRILLEGVIRRVGHCVERYQLRPIGDTNDLNQPQMRNAFSICPLARGPDLPTLLSNPHQLSDSALTPTDDRLRATQTVEG